MVIEFHLLGVYSSTKSLEDFMSMVIWVQSRKHENTATVLKCVSQYKMLCVNINHSQLYQCMDIICVWEDLHCQKDICSCGFLSEFWY